MWSKLRTLFSLFRELGFRWSAFRVAYAFRLRTGLVRLQMPQYQWNDRPFETWLKKNIPSNPEAYTKWRKQNQPKFFFDDQTAGPVGLSETKPISRPSELHPHLPWNSKTAIDEANRILSGEIKYFAHEFHRTGFPPNWHKDYVTLSISEESLPLSSKTSRSPQPLLHTVPASLRESDRGKHWSQILDDYVVARRGKPAEAISNDMETASATNASQRHYDIKFIWEPNRFAFVYALVRAYAATQDEKYAEAFWELIFDWAEHNPPNSGVNWKDGQEIALRLMAWTFGYYAFFNSPASKPQRIARFTQYVAAQAERIYKNIEYAISTRSNHTISEALGLWLVGLLLPEIKDAEKYLSLGKKLLEAEAEKQIFPDGSYSMYSLNYHRFVLQVYLYAIRLGEINHSPFSTQLINSVTKSIEYLSQLIDPETGQMPVYGSNDGALVLPLNNCDFTDYRPLLQLNWFITKGECLFEPGKWDEDIFWLCGEADSLPQRERAGVREISQFSFPHGGIYLLHGTNSKAIIRCTDFRARPSHADQLHVDLWVHGHNIAVDAGTYLYSGEAIWRNGLARTTVHNTVTVDHKDQMTMVSRFTWTNWSKGKVLQHNQKLWQGEHDSYKPVTHKRTVLSLDNNRWLVKDHIVANEPHHYALHWLLCDGDFGMQELFTTHGLWLTPTKMDSKLSDPRFLIQMGVVEGNGEFSLIRADPNSTRGWRSRYYGHKEPAISVLLEAYQPQVIFWTFFGFESDVVELVKDTLKVNSQTISLVE